MATCIRSIENTKNQKLRENLRRYFEILEEVRVLEKASGYVKMSNHGGWTREEDLDYETS